MGKSTISMAIFNSYVKLPEGSMLVHFTAGGFCGPESSQVAELSLAARRLRLNEPIMGFNETSNMGHGHWMGTIGNLKKEDLRNLEWFSSNQE